MTPPPENLVDALQRAAELATANDGIRFLDRTEREEFLDWASLHERALRAAGALHERGVRPGDRVAIILPTCPEFIDCWFGCHCLGAVPVALYPPVRLGRLDEYFTSTATMISSIKPSCLIADARVRKILGRLMPKVDLPLGLIKAESLLQGNILPSFRPQSSDTCMIQFSSGTTVAPKPVRLSHEQIIANTDAIMDFFPTDDGIAHAGVSWLPLYHDMGLIGCILPALLRPGPLTLIPPEAFLLRPSLWLRAISRYRATLSPAPDFAYGLCVSKIRDDELDGCDLSSWMLAMNGAESVSASRSRAFIERFSPWGFRPEAMTPVYGLSEASLAVTFSNPAQEFQRLQLSAEHLGRGEAHPINPPDSASPELPNIELTSVGRPLRGFSIEIRDDHGIPLKEDRVGQVWVTGPSLMQGYEGDLPSPLKDGWLHTGDLGFIHDQELYISGRAKDVIVLRGRNHNPVDIEESMWRVEEVRHGCAAAVGVIDSEGDHLMVFVEARKPNTDTAEQCRAAIKAGTGLDPDLVMILEPGVLPRTSSGKIRRAETLRRWQAGELKSPNKITPLLLSGAMAQSAWGYLRAQTLRNG